VVEEQNSVKHITFILLVKSTREIVEILKKNKNIAYLLLLQYSQITDISRIFYPYQGINDIAFFLPTSKSLCESQVGMKM
jgi:hypothetical protein